MNNALLSPRQRTMKTQRAARLLTSESKKHARYVEHKQRELLNRLLSGRGITHYVDRYRLADDLGYGSDHPLRGWAHLVVFGSLKRDRVIRMSLQPSQLRESVQSDKRVGLRLADLVGAGMMLDELDGTVNAEKEGN